MRLTPAQQKEYDAHRQYQQHINSYGAYVRSQIAAHYMRSYPGATPAMIDAYACSVLTAALQAENVLEATEYKAALQRQIQQPSSQHRQQVFAPITEAEILGTRETRIADYHESEGRFYSQANANSVINTDMHYE